MSGNGRRGASVPRRLQRGSAVVEYSIVAFLAVTVLVGVDENVVQMVMEAVRTMYLAFTNALSMTYPPVV